MFKQADGVKVEEERDVIAGKVRDTGLYPVILKYAYLDESKPNAATNNPGGAYNINLVFDDNGTEFKVTEYISSGKAKGQKSTYTDKNTKKERPLPGFSKMEAFFKQFTGKGIAAQEGEEKQLKIWNGTEEVLQPRNVFMDVRDVPMILGIVKILEDKHNAPGETREVIELDKFFDAEGFTANERKAGTPAVFKDEWLKAKPATYVKDKRKNKGKGPTTGAPTAGGPTVNTGAGSSLFGGAPADA